MGTSVNQPQTQPNIISIDFSGSAGANSSSTSASQNPTTVPREALVSLLPADAKQGKNMTTVKIGEVFATADPQLMTELLRLLGLLDMLGKGGGKTEAASDMASIVQTPKDQVFGEKFLKTLATLFENPNAKKVGDANNNLERMLGLEPSGTGSTAVSSDCGTNPITGETGVASRSPTTAGTAPGVAGPPPQTAGTVDLPGVTIVPVRLLDGSLGKRVTFDQALSGDSGVISAAIHAVKTGDAAGLIQKDGVLIVDFKPGKEEGMNALLGLARQAKNFQRSDQNLVDGNANAINDMTTQMNQKSSKSSSQEKSGSSSGSQNSYVPPSYNALPQQLVVPDFQKEA
jgi:hypothetical protein